MAPYLVLKWQKTVRERLGIVVGGEMGGNIGSYKFRGLAKQTKNGLGNKASSAVQEICRLASSELILEEKKIRTNVRKSR